MVQGLGKFKGSVGLRGKDEGRGPQMEWRRGPVIPQGMWRIFTERRLVGKGVTL